MSNDTKKKTEAAAAAAEVTPTVDPVAEAQAIIDAAKAQAEAIVAEAKEQAAAEIAEAKEAAAAAAAEEAAKKPKTVKIRLFKDNDKYRHDVFVAVNGRAIKIQRGVEVEIPVEYYEVLERSMTQDAATATLIEKESQGAKARELN